MLWRVIEYQRHYSEKTQQPHLTKSQDAHQEDFVSLNLERRNLYFPSSEQQRDTNIIIDEAAWQQFLKQFQSSMHVPLGIWLPVVIRGDQILLRKEHVYQIVSYNRLDAFVQMMLYALQPIQRRILATTTARKTTSSQEQQQQAPLQQDSLPLWKHSTIPLLLGIGDHGTCGGADMIFPRFSWCTTATTTPDDENNNHNNNSSTCQTMALPSFNLFLSRPETTTTHQQQQQRQARQTQQEIRYPWSKKQRRAVWRGAPTGTIPSVNGSWTSLPRAQLVQYSIAFPDLLDAAFVNTKQFQHLYPQEVPKLRQHSKFAKAMSPDEFQRYQAIVDIDGNAWSSRFGELLCMNSVVLKVQPKNKDYFWDELRPWEHYIHVKADMSDLMEKIQFVLSNEERARSIIRQANDWCETRLTRESMALDVFWMINSYIQMLGDNDTRWRQWEDVWDVYQRNLTMMPIESSWLGIKYWRYYWWATKLIRRLLLMT